MSQIVAHGFTFTIVCVWKHFTQGWHIGCSSTDIQYFCPANIRYSIFPNLFNPYLIFDIWHIWLCSSAQPTTIQYIGKSVCHPWFQNIMNSFLTLSSNVIGLNNSTIFANYLLLSELWVTIINSWCIWYNLPDILMTYASHLLSVAPHH